MALAEPHSPSPSFLACTVHQNSTTLTEQLLKLGKATAIRLVLRSVGGKLV